MRNKISGAILAVGLLVGAPGLVAGASVTGTILYGGVGGRDASDSENIGAIVILDQGDASLTLLGSPAPGIRLSGVAFDSTGALYASTIGAGLPPLTSTLLRVDPDTGALIAVVGPITDGAGGPAIGIADLAVQPGTDRLFGVRAPIDFLGAPGRLYVIDKATGVATLIGPTAARRAGIAFAPGGTLYETAFVPSPPALYTLNPATGGVLTSVPTAAFYPSLAARPTDAALFAGDGIEGLIFTLDPATGAATLLGNTSPTFVGGLTFRTCAISIGRGAGDLLARRRQQRGRQLRLERRRRPSRAAARRARGQRRRPDVHRHHRLHRHRRELHGPGGHRDGASRPGPRMTAAGGHRVSGFVPGRSHSGT